MMQTGVTTGREIMWIDVLVCVAKECMCVKIGRTKGGVGLA